MLTMTMTMTRQLKERKTEKKNRRGEREEVMNTQKSVFMTVSI